MGRLPFFDLLINAGPVVKGVLLLLAAASIASWAIAFEKLVRFVAFSKQVSGRS
jgi:biopolymer transport protein TolQ